jgi:hypothetical protein
MTRFGYTLMTERSAGADRRRWQEEFLHKKAEPLLAKLRDAAS